MNKKRILYFTIALLCIAALAIYKYVWSDTEDFSSKKPDTTYTFSTLMQVAESADSNKILQLKDKLIGIESTIKNITTDTSATSIELGDSTSMNSITCQIDKRHSAEIQNYKIGDKIQLKGKFNGVDKDEEMGLGTTVVLNYCVLNK